MSCKRNVRTLSPRQTVVVKLRGVLTCVGVAALVAVAGCTHSHRKSVGSGRSPSPSKSATLADAAARASSAADTEAQRLLSLASLPAGARKVAEQAPAL